MGAPIAACEARLFHADEEWRLEIIDAPSNDLLPELAESPNASLLIRAATNAAVIIGVFRIIRAEPIAPGAWRAIFKIIKARAWTHPAAEV